MTSTPLNNLDRAAERASKDDFFIGHLLASLVGSRGMARATIAQRLCCQEHQLARLWLCRAPREEALAFRQDVEQIASAIGCDATSLAQLVREAASLQALRSQSQSTSSSILLAARDRESDRKMDGPPDRGPNE